MNSDLWSYSGPPEYVSIRLKPVYPSSDGGYIVFIHLVDCRTWVFASNDPSKCLSKWNNITRKYGLPQARLAIVSNPFLLYPAVKNKIIDKLEPYKLDDTGAFQVELNTIIQEAEAVMKMAIPAIQ